MSPASPQFQPTPDLKPGEFVLLRDFVHATFGLDLREGKERLVSTRLGKHMRAGGFRSFKDYLHHVQSDKTGDSLVALIDALTTNHTNFLREPEHFKYMTETCVPLWKSRRSVTVWSAASSTGEEPYSILFSLLEARGTQATPEIRVAATDISTRVLRAAQEGIYASEKLSAVPQAWQQKYFKQLPGKASWQVRPEYRKMIEFKRFNLMDRFPSGQQYPLIFCRNVMIYFNRETQTTLVNKFSGVLEPEGHLFVGHSESLTGVEHSLKYVRPAIYRKGR